jgi:hypothetical protein
MAQRVVCTNGSASYLMDGDPEKDDDRFFFIRDHARIGAALPQLLSEGWVISSVTTLNRHTNPDDDYGCALVVLVRTD